MQTKQTQIEKFLVSRYGFVFKENINGAIGTRVVLKHLYGLEVSISPYRVCFYSSPAIGGVASNPFPMKTAPRCFDADKKGEINQYLEKLFAFTNQPVQTFVAANEVVS